MLELWLHTYTHIICYWGDSKSIRCELSGVCIVHPKRRKMKKLFGSIVIFTVMLLFSPSTIQLEAQSCETGFSYKTGNDAWARYTDNCSVRKNAVALGESYANSGIANKPMDYGSHYTSKSYASYAYYKD